MTKHTIPAEKPFEERSEEEDKVERFPTITFPASESQVSELAVGDAVKVTFDGNIESMIVSEGKRAFDRTEITLAINESDIVAVDGDGDISGVEEMGRGDPADIFS